MVSHGKEEEELVQFPEEILHCRYKFKNRKGKACFFHLQNVSSISKTAIKYLQKDKRKRWATGRFKSQRLPCLSAPSPPKKRILDVNEAEKQNHAENGTISTTAAETPHTISQDVWLGGSPQSSIQCRKESQEFSATNVFSTAPQSHECKLEIQHLAAIKIQSAFRGYLVSFSQAFLLSFSFI